MKLHKFIFILVLFLISACNQSGNHPVPSFPFDFSIDINLPSYSNLTGVGGWAYVNGGSRGIIVYRRSIDEFVAFDRHSPTDPEGNCIHPLYPDTSNFLVLKDSCANSTFSLYDGAPISNSEWGLRMYATQFNGSNLLRIYN